MAEHRPLRPAGGAGGVDEGGEVARPAISACSATAAAAAQRRGRVAALGGDDLAQRWAARRGAPRSPAATSGVQTTTFASESARMPTDLARGQRRVDRVEDRAEPEDRPPDLEVVRAVRQHDADHVALLDAELAQAGGDLDHPLVELARRSTPGGRRGRSARAPISCARTRSSSGRLSKSVVSALCISARPASPADSGLPAPRVRRPGVCARSRAARARSSSGAEDRHRGAPCRGWSAAARGRGRRGRRGPGAGRRGRAAAGRARPAAGCRRRRGTWPWEREPPLALTGTTPPSAVKPLSTSSGPRAVGGELERLVGGELVDRGRVLDLGEVDLLRAEAGGEVAEAGGAARSAEPPRSPRRAAPRRAPAAPSARAGGRPRASRGRPPRRPAAGGGDHQPAQRPEQHLAGEDLLGARPRRLSSAWGLAAPWRQVLRRDLGEVLLARRPECCMYSRAAAACVSSRIGRRRAAGPAAASWPTQTTRSPAPAETAFQAECSATGPSPQRQL